MMRRSGQFEVTVPRLHLLKTVKDNRANHIETYTKAEEGYREEAVERLQKMLASARQGKVELHIGLTPPLNQEKDYDRIILMLEMSTDETITLTESEFSQYVQDKWDWTDQFLASNVRYIK